MRRVARAGKGAVIAALLMGAAVAVVLVFGGAFHAKEIPLRRIAYSKYCTGVLDGLGPA